MRLGRMTEIACKNKSHIRQFSSGPNGRTRIHVSNTLGCFEGTVFYCVFSRVSIAAAAFKELLS